MTWGNKLEHSPSAFQTGRAVALLSALTDNVDVPGGNILGEHVVSDVDWLLDNLSEEVKQKRMGADTYKILCSSASFVQSAHVPTLFNLKNSFTNNTK